MDFSKYVNELPYPPHVPAPKAPKAPCLKARPSVDEIASYQKELESYRIAVDAYAEAAKRHAAEEVDRKRLIAEWNAEERRNMDRFKAVALDAVGLAGHPKAEKIFSYAWEKGHSSGFESVFGELEELSELFQD